LRLRWRHRWDVTPAEARRIQERGRRRATATGTDVGRLLRRGRIAAVDVAYDRTRDACFAALVIWDVRGGSAFAESTHAAASVWPYVPGLLSFREIPPLLPLFRAIEAGAIDLILCDGQGRAHPRRFGLATHLGVLYDAPSLGWAKTRLIGTHRPPGRRRGSAAALMDGAEQIGWALRSREGCRPTFVSPGHRISMEGALVLARGLLGTHRVCEPARRAHGLTTRSMREDPVG
jgi:deoxyribonuclease V